MVSEEQIEATRRVLLANDVASYQRVYEVFATADVEVAEDLTKLTMPVLAVTGSRDSGSTPEMTENLARAVPDGRSAVLEGARHMVPVERPADLAEIIHPFIEKQPSSKT